MDIQFLILNIKVVILFVVLFQLSLFLRFGGLVLEFLHLYRLFDLVGLMILKVILNLGARKLSRTEADFHERFYTDFILHIAITILFLAGFRPLFNNQDL